MNFTRTCCLYQIENHVMVTSQKKSNPLERNQRLENLEKSKRRTRKIVTEQVTVENNVISIDVSAQRTRDYEQRRKVAGETSRGRGKNLSKTISPAVVDVVFGSVRSLVADGEELRWKREENALRCGRKIKSILDLENDNHTPEKSSSASDVNTLQNASTATRTSTKSGQASKNIISSAILSGSLK